MMMQFQCCNAVKVVVIIGEFLIRAEALSPMSDRQSQLGVRDDLLVPMS